MAGAFYRPIGERSLENMAEIASAPGFSEMSDQDWKVYNDAKSQIAREQNPIEDSKTESSRENQDKHSEAGEKDSQNFSSGSQGTIFSQN